MKRKYKSYCAQKNQVRYYGIKSIDKDLLKKYKETKPLNFTKEQLKYLNLQDQVKIFLKNHKKITDELKEKLTPSKKKIVQKKLATLLKKKPILIKKIENQKIIYDLALKEKEKLELLNELKILKQSNTQFKKHFQKILNDARNFNY